MSEKNTLQRPAMDSAAVEAQHKAGKLTARERVEKILDANSFVEIGCFVQHQSAAFGLDKQAPGDGVVAGYGTIDCRPVYIYAQDFTSFDGALGAANAEKICRVYDAAIKNGAPIISVVDSNGARILDGVAALDGYAKIMKRAAKASGIIPQICVVAGACVGTAAVIAELADFVFVVEKNGSVAMTGAQILASMTGENITAQNLGGAEAAMKNGLCHFASASEEECFATLKELLALLPANNIEDAPFDYELTDDANRMVAEYTNTADLAAQIADNGVMLEVQSGYTAGMLTAFVKLGGRTVGVVANRPEAQEGRLCVARSNKAARFIRFCDSFNIPVVSLVDTAGFMIGKEQETSGLAKAAAKLAYAYAEATVPMISVICGKAIGGAYSIMGSHEIGADVVYAYPTAQIAPLNAESAPAVIFTEDMAKSVDPIADRAKFEKEYAQVYANPIEAAKIGSVDDIIEPAATRQMLIAALEMQAGKRDAAPAKRHDNMPF